MMQTLPGFRDFLPADCAVRNYMFRQWRAAARRCGLLVEWDGPILEPTELYRKKSGPEIVEQLFNFTDTGEREVAMRPELLPALAHVVAANERGFRKAAEMVFDRPVLHIRETAARPVTRTFSSSTAMSSVRTTLQPTSSFLRSVSTCCAASGFTSDPLVVRVSDRRFWTDFFQEKKYPGKRMAGLVEHNPDKFLSAGAARENRRQTGAAGRRRFRNL